MPKLSTNLNNKRRCETQHAKANRCCSMITKSQYNLYTDYVSARDFFTVITMTIFPACVAVAVGLDIG